VHSSLWAVQFRVQIPVLHALICSKPLLNLYGNAPETYDLRALRKSTTTQEKNYRKYLNSHYSRILTNPRRTHLKLVSNFEVNFKLLS
jgi:hypothetical protein